MMSEFNLWVHLSDNFRNNLSKPITKQVPGRSETLWIHSSALAERDVIKSLGVNSYSLNNFLLLTFSHTLELRFKKIHYPGDVPEGVSTKSKLMFEKKSQLSIILIQIVSALSVETWLYLLQGVSPPPKNKSSIKNMGLLGMILNCLQGWVLGLWRV